MGVELDRKLARDGGAGGWRRDQGTAAQDEARGKSCPCRHSVVGGAVGGSQIGGT